MCNFVTVDGRYEDDEGDIASFFTHQHPDATAIRRQFAALFRDVSKVVVSDTITEADLEPYENVRIVRIADARAEVARLKAEAGSYCSGASRGTTSCPRASSTSCTW